MTTSPREALLRLTPEKLKRLSPAELSTLGYDWPFWARPDQLPPAGNWRYWLVLAGRGFGKTRIGAEWVRTNSKTSRFITIAGATSDDARSIMVEGESGILAVCPDGDRPKYLAHKRELHWPNGSKTLIMSADEPERFRGKQHELIWADELASWRYPESWDQAMLGMRLGKPRALITTTPRPTMLIRRLLDDPHTHTTRGSTYDNRSNLAAEFFDTIIRRYEGTRMGRQELNAELLTDNPGALWQRDALDVSRVTELPAMRRIVVGVDPAATGGEDSDMTGIVVAGLGIDGRGYVIADYTLRATPDAWARKVVYAVEQHKADRVIVEVNNGGDMCETVLRHVASNLPITKVHASHGKWARAEPIAALYEQGRVSHVGCLPELEDQMCDYTPGEGRRSPDRIDAMVWALTHLLPATLGGQVASAQPRNSMKGYGL
jgi:phage terminase large subunit-like protein